jgi:hypothetical protein
LDGTEIAAGVVTYSGPTGLPKPLWVPWTATSGTHTITWQAIPGTTDPDTANNEVSRSFSAHVAVTTTTRTADGTSKVATVVSVTTATTQVYVQTVTTATVTALAGVCEMVQQNIVPLGSLFILVVVTSSVLFVRERTRGSRVLLCSGCGRQNPRKNQFCGSCGRPLRDETRIY